VQARIYNNNIFFSRPILCTLGTQHLKLSVCRMCVYPEIKLYLRGFVIDEMDKFMLIIINHDLKAFEVDLNIMYSIKLYFLVAAHYVF